MTATPSSWTGRWRRPAEQIAGYYLLDCEDLDEVIAIAARVPAARHGTIEIRPVWDYEQDVDNLG